MYNQRAVISFPLLGTTCAGSWVIGWGIHMQAGWAVGLSQDPEPDAFKLGMGLGLGPET